MKYRKLSKEELQELKSEFIQFLVANGLDAAEWKRLNEEDLDAANEMVDLFSDVVFDKALKNIKFLKHVSKHHIKYFYCTEKKIVLLSISAHTNSPLDFTKAEVLNNLASGEETYEKGEITYSTSEKEYEKERNLEVFELMNQGSHPCTKEEFEKVYEVCK
jgi:hypothetical protein